MADDDAPRPDPDRTQRAPLSTRGVRFAGIFAVAIVLCWSALATAWEGKHRDQGQSRDLSLRLAQARLETPRVAIAPTILASPASRVRLQIAIHLADTGTRRGFVRLTGLPPLASLSQGHAISPGAWTVPLSGLDDLNLTLPAVDSGRYQVTITLVAEDGAFLAQATTYLVVAPQLAAPEASTRREPLVLSPADRESAEKLIARGERDLQDGNIALARQFFLRGAEAGVARAALLLGSTYDQAELARMGVRSVQANPALARKWYERARELGAPEAEERLAKLGGG